MSISSSTAELGLSDLDSMNSIEFLTRNSLASMQSGAQTSMVISETILADEDEIQWQWFYLKNQVKSKNAEGLLFKYQARVQHSLFVVLLILNMVFELMPIIVALAMRPTAEVPEDEKCKELTENIMVPIIFRFVAFLIHLSVFIISYREYLFSTSLVRLVASSIVMIAMFCSEYGTTLNRFRTMSGNRHHTIRYSFYYVITVTIFLPFPEKWQAMLAGVLVVTMEMVFTGIDYDWSSSTAKFIAAETVAHVVALFMGIYVRFLMDLTNRKSFLDRRKCLETKYKLNCEKTREDQLLLSVIPKHIAEDVRKDVRKVLQEIESGLVIQKPFNQLFISNKSNVSILYADIVNSMKLASSLDVSDLVETLDELFGKFDERAQANDCLRIKLLGDCYYCVSGVPEYTERHAINCVNMGLDMIDIIRHVRETRSVDVDMRIGVHTGNVLCGLLGLKRWQYDIWSQDVTIASRMEQSGEPGCVHVTKTTLDLLDGSFIVREGHGPEKDEYLRQAQIETFLIYPRPKRSPLQKRMSQFQINNESNNNTISKQGNFIKRQSGTSTGTLKPGPLKVIRRISSNDALVQQKRRQGHVLDYSLHMYRRMVFEVNTLMEAEIYKMALSKVDQWCRPEGIHPLFLCYQTWHLEYSYIKQADPLFRYYLLSVFVVLIGMAVIHFTVGNRSNNLGLIVAYIITFIFLILTNVAAWAGFVWATFLKPDKELSRFSKNFWIQVGRKITHSFRVRVVLWFMFSFLLYLLAFLGTSGSNDSEEVLTTPLVTTTENYSYSETNFSSTTEPAVVGNFQLNWSYIFCIVLSMTAPCVFLRINFYLKFTANFFVIIAYIVLFSESDVKSITSTTTIICSDWGFTTATRTEALFNYIFYLFIIYGTLHILDRQIEYMCRVDFLSREKLKTEQKEAEMMARVNRTLLHNILPEHVAMYYLDPERRRNDELYHEEYTSVAVMFASIPNFTDFYMETDLNLHGRNCLQLLNEIICDFDTLLFTSHYSKIEKIKTVGSTYMAAAGLQPGRNSIETQIDEEHPEIEEDPIRNVHLMVQFATAMMEKLQILNEASFQEFRLRIGIAVGGVIAGVVGTVKPQYDIWGDTVNVASRMDSTGIMGRIQVTEDVACILMDTGTYECESRGRIFVKGKGELTTYMVKTKYDEPIEEVSPL